MENFNWGNLIGNVLQLAAETPNNPDLMADILSRLTGHTFVRATGEGRNDTRNDMPNRGELRMGRTSTLVTPHQETRRRMFNTL